MDRDALESAMLESFLAADTNGDGVLNEKEFKQCLEGLWLDNTRLTKKEVNMIFASVDVNADGTISYAEFVPLMYDWMISALKNGFTARDASMLEKYSIDTDCHFTSKIDYILMDADVHDVGMLIH